MARPADDDDPDGGGLRPQIRFLPAPPRDQPRIVDDPDDPDGGRLRAAIAWAPRPDRTPPPLVPGEPTICGSCGHWFREATTAVGPARKSLPWKRYRCELHLCSNCVRSSGAIRNGILGWAYEVH